MNNRRLERIEADLARRPLWPPVTATSSIFSHLVIINGNSLAAGLKGISYSGTLSLASLPDIDASTDVATGLGRGFLYLNGSLVGRVWVRHDRQDSIPPLIASSRRLAGDLISISYGAGSISAYRWIP